MWPDILRRRMLRRQWRVRRAGRTVAIDLWRERQRLRGLRFRTELHQWSVQLWWYELQRLLLERSVCDLIERDLWTGRHRLRDMRRRPGVQRAGRFRVQCNIVPDRLLLGQNLRDQRDRLRMR
jgi:hypothetical protein